MCLNFNLIVGGLIAVTEDDLITYLSRQYCGFGKLEDPLAMGRQTQLILTLDILVTAHLIFRKENNIVTIVNEAIQKNKMLIERAFRKYRDHSALRTASGHCKKPKIAASLLNVKYPFTACFRGRSRFMDFSSLGQH